MKLRLVTFVTLLGSIGCGVAPPKADPKQVPTSKETVEAAEVTESFRGFDSAVQEPIDQPSTTQPVTEPTKKPPIEPAEASQPTKPPVLTPTAEQLERWTVARYEPLQLLACRDSQRAGFLTSAAVIGNGETYGLAGNRLTIWNLNEDQPTHDLSDPKNEQVVKCLRSSLDGKWLATGDGNGNIQIWDLPDFKQRIAKKVYPSGVAHLSISPDSMAIATASFTGEVTIWDAVQLTVKNKFTVAEQALQGILFIASNRLVTASEDASIWNTETGKLEHSLTTGGYHATLASSSDGKLLAYCNEGKMQLWNVQESKIESTIQGSFSRSDLAAFSPDGKYLVTASRFEIQIWDISTNQLVQVIDTFGWETIALNWMPKSSLLMISSENGRVRFWGNAAAASALGWKPMQQPVELPSLESGESASPAQLMQVVDIRTLPKLPGSTMSASNETLINYSAPVAIDEARVFYAHFLTREGWQATNIAKSAEMMDFTKQGFGLSLYFSKNADGSTQVNLNASGNVDLGSLPRFDSKPPEVVYEAENGVVYRLKEDLLTIETELIRKFYKAGWTSYARLNASKSEEVDQRDLQLVKGATTLRVMIQRQPADPTLYHVSYSKFLTTKSLPIPRDSGFIEFDGSTQPMMVASTAMTIEQTRDFFEKEMAAEGWSRRDSGKQFKEDSGWMEFIRGQCDVSMSFEKLETGRTQIRVGEGLEGSSWQLKKPAAAESNATAGGIEAADIRALNDWSIVRYDAEQKQIDLVAKGATTREFSEAYTKEFASHGWNKDGSGVESDDYCLIIFKKEKAELSLRATLRSGQIQAIISGDGLLWTKPLPVAKQVISYETWLRINRHPATLDLIDQYTAEMKEILNGK